MHDAVIRHVMLSPQGYPVVTLSYGSTFVYDQNMACWLSIHDAGRFWKSTFQSTFSDHLEKAAESNRLLSRIQSYGSASSLAGFPFGASGFVNAGKTQHDATMYHLEHQIMASIMLESWEEFSTWVQAYASQLIKQLGPLMAFGDGGGPKPDSLLRLGHLCDWLVGDLQDHSMWNQQARGVLLKQIIPMLATVESLQTMAMRYQKMCESAA